MTSDANILGTLIKVLKSGTMSPMLTRAVLEAIRALKAGDLDLAYQITACKSHICGNLGQNHRTYAFREDHAANEKKLGDSLYGILDGIHFQLAMMLHKIPSGMMVVSSSPQGGAVEEMRHVGEHPIVKRIAYESAQCARRAGARA
jgi:hypothetical protein